MADYKAKAPTITDHMTMLAIYPPSEVMEFAHDHADDDVVENGLHMTLMSLDRTTEKEADLLYRACQRIAQLLDPITLSVEGSGVFNAPDMYVRWLLINGAGLDAWRGAYLELLKQMGLLPNQRYGYTPHMTLGYYQKDDGGLPDGWEDMEGYDGLSPWHCDSIYLVRGKHYRKRIQVGPPNQTRW